MNALKIFSLGRVIFAAVLLIAVPLVRAESLPDVRARMAERLSQIDQLKASGAVGENNRGLLEARGAGADGALVSAENSDREKVYAAIAEKTKTSAEEVAKARARQIAAASSPGVWIQDADGTWKKK